MVVGKVPLRIAVVQLRPRIGEVQANILRARELCHNIQPRTVDLVCFPEMAFTGYVFDSAASIYPHLEHPLTGPTSRFCAELAEHLKCYVVAGYPERLAAHESGVQVLPRDDALPSQMQMEEDGKTNPDSTDAANGSLSEPNPELEIQVGANSAVLYGPEGKWVGGYRKTNLFETDRTWAKPGTGFASFTLPLPLSRSPDSSNSHSSPTSYLSLNPPSQTIELTLAICMDLNPHPPHSWTSADGPYELADYCIEQKTRVLVLLNAWLESGKHIDGEEGEEDEEDSHDWHTLRYWAARLRPLWRKNRQRSCGSAEHGSGGSDDSEEEGEKGEETNDETIVVVCNRTGEENGKTFAGTSAIFSTRTGTGRAKLLDMMSRREEGVRIWDLLI